MRRAPLRRSESVEPGIADEATAREVVRSLAAPLLAPVAGIRALHVRLARLAPPPAAGPPLPRDPDARSLNGRWYNRRPMAKASDVARTARILGALEQAHPEAACALHYENAFELVASTILSAQCTDERVNMVTPVLFGRYPTPAALAEADPAELESIIRSTGFFRAKTRSLIGCARALVRDHGGEVPRTLDALVKLPGIGRKTANVVLGHAFGIAEGIAVDTHVLRVSNRLGMARGRRPDRRGAAAHGPRPAGAVDAHDRPPHLPRAQDLRRPSSRLRHLPDLRALFVGRPAGLGDRAGRKTAEEDDTAQAAENDEAPGAQGPTEETVNRVVAAVVPMTSTADVERNLATAGSSPALRHRRPGAESPLESAG